MEKIINIHVEKLPEGLYLAPSFPMILLLRFDMMIGEKRIL